MGILYRYNIYISHLQTPICTENQPFLEESIFPTHGRGVMEGWYPLLSPLKWLVWKKTSSQKSLWFPIEWWLYQHWLVAYHQKKSTWRWFFMNPRNSHGLLVLSGQQILQAARCYHSHWKLLKKTWGTPTNFEIEKQKEHHVHPFLWQNLYVCDRSNFILVWW